MSPETATFSSVTTSSFSGVLRTILNDGVAEGAGVFLVFLSFGVNDELAR